MSKIPFVNQLGDALESAAAARIAARRSRIRRRAAVGAIGVAIAASGVAAASGVLSGTPEQLAANSVACYDRASFEANAAVLSTGDASPVETCARILGTDRPLVACAHEGAVAVFPGDRRTCGRLGLAPLPPEYANARARVNAFAREVMAIEAAADCIPPRELAARVQRLLDRSPGWEAWTTWLRLDVEDGPCGSVSGLGGGGSRTIEGALDADGRRVMVFGGASRSTTDLLYGAGRLAPELQDASGERCFTRAGLEAMVRDRVAPTGRQLTIVTGEQNGVPIGARGRRWREGCAIVSDVSPAADGRGVVVGVVY